MRRKLQSIASQLSEDDIQEIIRLKKAGGKRATALRKKRDKLAAQLEAIDAELVELTGESPAAAPKKRGRKPGRKPGKKPGRKPAAAKATKKRSGRRNNLSAAVREVFRKAGEPLKASQVVDGLPKEGIKVKDVADMKKRISVVLASQKNHFEQVERGLYQLKSE